MTTVDGGGVLVGSRCHDVCDPQIRNPDYEDRSSLGQAAERSRSPNQIPLMWHRPDGHGCDRPGQGGGLGKAARHPAAGGIATTMSSERKLTLAAGAYLIQSTRIHDRVATGGFDGTADRQSIVLPDADAMGLFAAMRDGNLS
jgi:hypothetical protein